MTESGKPKVTGRVQAARLPPPVSDGSVLRLIRAILKAGVIEPDAAEQEPTELGTPQGGPISPLLANIYLQRFDEAVSKAGYGLVRYADDFVIFTRPLTICSVGTLWVN